MDITFFSALPNFIDPIAKHMATDTNNHIKVFQNGSQQDLMGSLQTCEVGWFDFANELLIASQAMYKVRSFRCIVRIHSYEAFTDMPKRIDWSLVDDVVFVNPSVRGVMQMYGTYEELHKNCRVHIIPNMIDTDKFKFVKPEAKHNKIGYLGHINYKKDPSLIMPISESLEGYKTHVAGEFQDTRYKMAFEQYTKAMGEKHLTFDGFQSNVNDWFSNKRYILNTSLFESHNLAMSEGMLCGAFPLLRNWVGSENIYPDVKTWDSIHEIPKMVKKFDALNYEEQEKILLKHRKFIIDNYDKRMVMPKIESLINETANM